MEASRLVKGTLWVSVSRLLEGVVALVFSVYVARSLGGDYGYVGATMGVYGILNIASQLGIGSANTRFVAALAAKGETGPARTTVSRAFLLEGLVATIFSIGLYISADVLATDIFSKPEMASYLRLVSPMLLIGGLGGIWLSTFQGIHRYDAFAILITVNPFVRLAVAVALLAMGWGVEGALLGFIMGHAATLAVGTAIGLALVPKELPAGKDKGSDIEGPPSSRTLLTFGSVVTLGTMATVVYEWTDKLMLTASNPIEDVAYYTIAYGMVALPLLIPRAISTTYFPAISALYGSGDMDRFRSTTERVMAFTMIIMAFIPFGMMAIAPWVVGVLYGEEFLPAVAPFMVLSVWGLFRPIGLLAHAIPQSMNRPSVGAAAMGLTAVLNVVLNAVMIPLYGMMGAALATTLSYLIGFSYLTNVSMRMAGARFPWAPVSKAVVSAAVAAVVMHVAFLLLEPHFDPAGPSWSLILPVLAVGFSGLGLYILLLGLTRAVTREDARFVRSLGIFGTGRLADVLERVANMRRKPR